MRFAGGFSPGACVRWGLAFGRGKMSLCLLRGAKNDGGGVLHGDMQHGR